MMKSVFAAAAVLSLSVAGQAFAGASAEAPQELVRSAVNYQDPAAVDALYTKLRRAAVVVCDSNSANPRVTQGDALCARQALADVVRRVDRPMLTAMHERARTDSDVRYATRR